MSTYQSVVLAKRPVENIIPGETFAIKNEPMPTEADVKDGQVLIEVLYLSLDPAMRGWLKDARSYLPPVQIGEVMRGVSVGRVIASKFPAYPVGTVVTTTSGWKEYVIKDGKEAEKFDIPAGAKITDALGVLGMTGLTAYFGMLDIGQPKEGDVVVVSGAAGATGSVAGQLAKLKGAKKLIGTAGSDEKCEWLKTIGFDEALNYKSPDFAQKFKDATKEFIDVFYDNVGGEQLDMALGRAKPHARFVMCGGISQYNAAVPSGPKNYLNIISMRIRMEGFIVLDHVKRFGEARKNLSEWLGSGKIQRKETIIEGGLASAEKALVDLYAGINTGKLLVEVKPESSPSAKL